MKKCSFLSKVFQFFGSKKKLILMEDLYQIVGHVLEGSYNDTANHPKIPIESHSNIAGNYVSDEDAYVRHVKKLAKKHDIEKHIIIDKNSNVFISETNSHYPTMYKITIKKLIIETRRSSPLREMFFDHLISSLDSKLDLDTNVGIHLVFEKNHFIGINRLAVARFCPRRQAYLVFKKNEFISGDLLIEPRDSSKIELTDNIFRDSHVEITAQPSNEVQGAICIENNTFYKNEDIFSRLIFNGEENTKCYFKGKNTLDNLIISKNNYLHWGGYQNIDPQGNHAHTHKEMFIKLKKKAIDNNDKMQEAILHKELLKCDKALIREEKPVRSLQDGFIMWWSGWISDYGVSWFRPVRLLIYINVFFATLVFYSFECQSSWSLLFAEFFNPLSSLVDVMNAEKSGLISFINILQKALLAIFIYEIIKIFRRFSK